MPVIELERATLVEAASTDTRIEVSLTVATSTIAGGSETIFIVEPPALDGEAYPALVAVWDNDDDAIFDTL